MRLRRRIESAERAAAQALWAQFSNVELAALIWGITAELHGGEPTPVERAAITKFEALDGARRIGGRPMSAGERAAGLRLADEMDALWDRSERGRK